MQSIIKTYDFLHLYIVLDVIYEIAHQACVPNNSLVSKMLSFI